MEVICELCTQYREGTLISSDPLLRFCKKKSESVSPKKEHCEDFEQAPFFWCIADSCWLDNKVCIVRKAKRKCPQNCKRGALIEEASRAEAFYKRKRGEGRTTLQRRVQC